MWVLVQAHQAVGTGASGRGPASWHTLRTAGAQPRTASSPAQEQPGGQGTARSNSADRGRGGRRAPAPLRQGDRRRRGPERPVLVLAVRHGAHGRRRARPVVGPVARRGVRRPGARAAAPLLRGAAAVRPARGARRRRVRVRDLLAPARRRLPRRRAHVLVGAGRRERGRRPAGVRPRRRGGGRPDLRPPGEAAPAGSRAPGRTGAATGPLPAPRPAHACAGADRPLDRRPDGRPGPLQDGQRLTGARRR